MPTMANITVKKADGTTDIVYSAIQPAGGDKSPAIWRPEAIGNVAGNRPVFKLSTNPTADGKARVVDWSLQYPETYTNTTTGVTSVRLSDKARGTFIISLDAVDATHTEMAAQAANLLKSALIQSCITSGQSAV